MAESDPVRHIPPQARTAGEQTPGMVREQALAIDGMWAGVAHTEPGMVSGWHHHGDYESAIYVLSGRLRMESGPGGREVIEAAAGDFLHVPRGAIHREGNPGIEPSEIIVVRAGDGASLFNVGGPPPSA